VTMRCILVMAACFIVSVPAKAGHTLSSAEQQTLKNWLALHPEYREATDEDCGCAANIQQVRSGSGGIWKPVPDYHPYVATGDFNSDGVEDFAVVLIDRKKKEKNFVLVVFNGPFKSLKSSPTFTESDLELQNEGLFYGPPRPKPYRLLLGRFESDSGALLIPHGPGYKWDDSPRE
jgi:hypothetical protein